MKAAVLFCLGLVLFLLCGRSEARALRPAASKAAPATTIGHRLFAPQALDAAALPNGISADASALPDLEDEEEESHQEALVLLRCALASAFGILFLDGGSEDRPLHRPHPAIALTGSRRYLALCSLRL